MFLLALAAHTARTINQTSAIDRGKPFGLGRCKCDAPAPTLENGLPVGPVADCRASNLTITDYPAVTLEVLSAFRVCGECQGGVADFRRIGDYTAGALGPSDGGYLMCDAALRASGAAISIGIESRDGWGSMLAVDYRMPVDQYDCSGAAPACAIRGRGKGSLEGCENLTRYHHTCVGAADTVGRGRVRNGKFMPLSEMVAAARARIRGERRELVLKIDPEGAEVEVGLSMSPE